MIRAMIAKDLWLLVRDRGALISLFVLPLAFMLAFGLVFQRSPDRGQPWRIALWHAADDPRGAAIARALAAPGAAGPGGGGGGAAFTTRVAGSAGDVRRAVAGEAVDAGVVVPVDPAAPVELVIDLGAPVQARGPLEGALTTAVTGALTPRVASPPRVEVRAPPGRRRALTGASPFQIAVPANAVLFGFFLALTVAMAFAGERRTGTWRRLLAAPVSRRAALLAGLAPYYLVGVVQLAFLFGAGALAFGMPIGGSLVALAALCVAVVHCAVSLGLLLAAVTTSERQLGGVGAVALLIMGLVGGCMVPRLAMPAVMQRIGLAVPHGWALDGFHDVIVREGTRLADVAPALAALAGFGCAFAALGARWFRWQR